MRFHTGGFGMVAAGLLVASGLRADAPIPVSSLEAGVHGFALNAEALVGPDGDNLGRTVSAAGDVNGDGLGDIIVSAPVRDIDGAAGSSFHGCSYVVFGKTGASPTLDMSAVAAGVGGFVIRGLPWSRSGWSVATGGDVNADGLADVLIGAPYETVNGDTNTGRAYVVFGRTATTPVELSAVAAGNGGYVLQGPGLQAYAGWGVAAGGDINQDGFDDVLVGAPGVDGGKGRLYVHFGKSNTLQVFLSFIGPGIFGTPGFRVSYSGTDMAGLGNSVASAGDVNGDGYPDIIVGAETRFKTISTGGFPASSFDTTTGEAYVVFGKTTNSAVQTSSLIAGTGGFVIESFLQNAYLGSDVAGLGDMNNDGLADVGLTNGLRGFSVLFGRTATTPVNADEIGSTFPGWAGWGGPQGFEIPYLSMASAGDINGDGRGDLVIGDAAKVMLNKQNAGRTYVVFGKTNTDFVNLDTLENNSAQGVEIHGTATDQFVGSSACGAGDFNGDGIGDLLVGATEWWSSFNSPEQNGRAYMVLSPWNGPPILSNTSVRHPAGATLRTAAGASEFGSGATMFPASRLWIDFAAGTNASLTNVSLIRTKSSLSGHPANRMADVTWNMTTNRTNFATADVTVRYTNAEIASLDEAQLQLYSATSNSGPWTPLTSQVKNPARNEITATTSSIPAGGLRLMLAVPTPTPTPTPTPSPTPVPINGDANNDGVVNIADVTTIHLRLAGWLASLPGDGDVTGEGDVEEIDAELILDHLANGTPLP